MLGIKKYFSRCGGNKVFRFIQKSFKAKMVLIITISIFLSGVGISAIILKSQYDSQLKQMKIDGINIARITAKNIENASKEGTKESLQKVVEELGTSNGIQYTALISKDMMDVIDSQEEEIGKSFADDEATIAVIKDRIDSPSFYVDPTGSTVLDIQVPVDFRVENIQIAAVDIGISMDTLYENIYKSIIKSCILTLALIIIFSIIPIIILNNIVIKPLRQGVKLATAIANKDLRVTVKTRSKDEIGSIINSIEQAKNNLKDIIKQAQNSTDEVTSASGILHLSLDNIANKTQKMTIFVDEMNNSMEENVSTIESTNDQVEEMVYNSNKISENCENVKKFMISVNDSAQTGKNSIQEIISTIDEIDLSSKNVVNYMSELEQEMIRIEDIVNAISKISEQTNLLALNASIEAARAGEAGKGFAVVAEEVKKLAEESANSLKGIDKLTGDIKKKTQKVVETVGLTTDKINIGVTQSNIAGHNVGMIIEAVKKVENSESSVAQMALNQSESVKNMQKSMNKIALKEEVNTEKAHKMTEDIEQQMSEFEEINSISNELADMSVNLAQLVNTFKVD